MEPRRIAGLRTACLCDPPSFSKHRRPKGKRGKGLTYERSFGRWLKRKHPEEVLVSGQWFLFWDANGVGHAQTDYILLREKLAIIFECKLTQTDKAEVQLKGLYLPLVRSVYKRSVVLCQVCKNLRRSPSKKVDSLEDLINYPRPGVMTWHWLGSYRDDRRPG